VASVIIASREHFARERVTLFRSWRRKRLVRAARIDDALWRRVIAGLPFLAGMSDDELGRLRELALLFVHEKEMHGAGGLELTDEIRLAIAVQAVLPVLNLGLDPYEGWVGVVVYPGEFRVRRRELDEDGVMHEWDDELSGEAWPGGPVLLSWEDVALGNAAPEQGGEPGYNVVIHEFAHKIDMLKGEANGYPTPHRDMDRTAWGRALESAYARFVGMVEREQETLLDPYAAEHPAEFFAVASEAFFTDPHTLKKEFGALYDQLALFYRQDPAARLPPR
jgi:MtfA peptidase